MLLISECWAELVHATKKEEQTSTFNSDKRRKYILKTNDKKIYWAGLWAVMKMSLIMPESQASAVYPSYSSLKFLSILTMCFLYKVMMIAQKAFDKRFWILDLNFNLDARWEEQVSVNGPLRFIKYAAIAWALLCHSAVKTRLLWSWNNAISEKVFKSHHFLP